MSKENPLLRAIEEKQKRERDIGEAFEKWFEAVAATINPLMTKDDAKRIFRDGFDLGHGYAMGDMLRSLQDFAEGKRK